MTLAFPNRSRSFDTARNAVRFIGHDGMFEVPFFIEAQVLPGSDRKDLSEAECLAAFDAARASIHEVANEVYANSRRNVLHLDCRRFPISGT